MKPSFKEIALATRQQYFENLKYTHPGKIPVVVLNKSKEAINFDYIVLFKKTHDASS